MPHLRSRSLLLSLLVSYPFLFTSALGATDLAVVRDFVYTPAGEIFQGVLRITPAGFPEAIRPPTISVTVKDGLLSVRLVPCPSNVATYLVVYVSSDRVATWSETWRVPASNRLRLADVLLPQGATGDSRMPREISLPIPMSGVINLTSDLASINNSLANLMSTVTSLSSNAQVLTASTPVIGEVPNGSVNGTNSVFALTNAPLGMSLAVFRNGQRQALGTDFMLAGRTITFLGAAVPGAGDALLANYVIANASQPAMIAPKDITLPIPISDVAGLSAALNSINTSVTSINNTVASLSANITTLNGIALVSGETPAGPINGANLSFTVASSPINGLITVFRNGIRQAAGTDFSLSGRTLVFMATAVPQNGDILLADYEHH
jgi:uncharacterized protein YoxC